jgi:serine/threonine-protein kinase RsbT
MATSPPPAADRRDGGSPAAAISVAGSNDIGPACEVARRMARQAGISSFGVTEAVTAVAEVLRDVLTRPGGVTVEIRVVEEGGRRGLVISATGPADGVVVAMTGARRLMDQVTVAVRADGATTIEMVKWAGR